MANNIALSITADVADLQVKRAIMSAELKAATKDLNQFAKEAAGGANTEALREGMLSAATAAEKAKAGIAQLNTELKAVATAAAPAAAGVEHAQHGFAALSATVSETGIRLRETVGMVGELREAMMAFGELMLAAFAIEAIKRFAEKLGEAAEKTKHISEQLGLTIAETQGLEAAAAGVGVPFDGIVKGMGLLDKKFETTPKLFQQLGIILPQNASQMQILAATMDRFEGLADGPKKTALALTLMGKAGKELIPFLNEGSKGLEELFAKAAKYGAVSQDASTKGVALAEAINEGKIASMGLSNTMTRAFGPVLQSAVEGFNNMVAAITKSYNEGGAAKVIFDGIAGTFQLLGSTIAALAPVFDGLGTSIKFISDNIGIILPIAGAVATLFAGPLLEALLGSTLAMIAQSTAMGALVAGFISEGLIGGVVAAYGLLTGGIGAATIAAWEFTVALLANPLTWIVGLCAAAVGGLVYLAMHVKSTRDAFEFLWDGVKIVVAYIVGDIDLLKVTLLAFAKLAWDAFTLNWPAVQADWQAGLQGVENSVRTTANNIKKLMDDAKSHLAYSGSDDKYDPHALDEIMHKVKPPADVNLEHQAKPKKAKAAPKEKDLTLQTWRTELSDMLAAETNWGANSNELSLKFWTEKLAQTAKGSKDELEIRREVNRLKLALFKQEQTDTVASLKAIETIRLEDAKTEIDLAKIGLHEKIALIDNAEVAGRISATRAQAARNKLNAELYALDTDLENKTYALKRAMLEAEINLDHQSEEKKKALRSQELVLVKQHEDRLVLLNAQKNQKELADDQKLILQRKLLQANAAKSISQSWAQSLSQMLTLQSSFANGIKGLWTGIQQAIGNALTSVIQQWLDRQIAALILGRAQQAVTGVAQVTSNAGIAGAAAYASTAAIPIIGPALAPAAAASAVAGALSFLPLASAEGGDWQVRAGLYNLHQDEMVLPAWAATPLRQSLLGGGTPSFGAPANDTGGDHYHFNIAALDGHSVKRVLMDNKHSVAKAVNAAVRNGFQR